MPIDLLKPLNTICEINKQQLCKKNNNVPSSMHNNNIHNITNFLSVKECYDFVLDCNNIKYALIENDIYFSFFKKEPFTIFIDNNLKTSKKEPLILIIEDFYEQNGHFILNFKLESSKKGCIRNTKIYEKEYLFEEIKRDKVFNFSIISALLYNGFLSFENCPDWYFKKSFDMFFQILEQQISACEKVISYCLNEKEKNNKKISFLEEQCDFLLMKKICFNRYKRIFRLEEEIKNIQKDNEDADNYIRKMNEKKKEITSQMIKIKTRDINFFSKNEKSVFSKNKKTFVFQNLNHYLNFKNENPIITGCYIIKNILNGKIYVGQSINIPERIRQHFHQNCYPKNEIFLSDFFNTPERFRNNLFDIAFVPCDSSLNLNKLEKDLIEYFDSFNTGYNRTRGNNT